MRKTLKRTRRAAGRVRDCDVFGKRVAGPPDQWPSRLQKERARAHKHLVAEYHRFGKAGQLRRRTAKLLDRLKARHTDRQERFLNRAHDALRPIATAFFEAAPNQADGDRALHRFRLAGKDLRYAMELLAPAFVPSFKDELYPALGALQEKLGLLNDLASVQRRLCERIDRTGDPAELSDLRRRQAATGGRNSSSREVPHRAERAPLQARFVDYRSPSVVLKREPCVGLGRRIIVCTHSRRRILTIHAATFPDCRRPLSPRSAAAAEPKSLRRRP